MHVCRLLPKIGDEIARRLGGHVGGEGCVTQKLISEVAHPCVEVVERLDQVVLEVCLGLLQPDRRVGERAAEGLPLSAQVGQFRQLRVRDVHLELLEKAVLRLERLEARLGLLNVAVLLLMQLDVLGQLVQVDGLLREGGRHGCHVLVHGLELGGGVGVEELRELVLPRAAVLHQRLLERRRVDPDKAELELFVPRNVGLEGGEGAVGLGVAPHESVLVDVPDVLVPVPRRQVLLRAWHDVARAGDDGHQHLVDVLVVGDGHEKGGALGVGADRHHRAARLVLVLVLVLGGPERLGQPEHRLGGGDGFTRHGRDRLRELGNRRLELDF
eukprot:1805050-Pleurochrysis_carterae.AAC.1